MPEFATDAAAEVATDEDSLINFVTDENMVDKNWILKRRTGGGIVVGGSGSLYYIYCPFHNMKDSPFIFVLNNALKTKLMHYLIQK